MHTLDCSTVSNDHDGCFRWCYLVLVYVDASANLSVWNELAQLYCYVDSGLILSKKESPPRNVIVKSLVYASGFFN